MKRILILSAALALSACGTVPKRVEVPIPVECRVKVPVEPLWATDALPPGAGLFDKVKALLAERQQRIAYETELRAAARACQ